MGDEIEVKIRQTTRTDIDIAILYGDQCTIDFIDDIIDDFAGEVG